MAAQLHQFQVVTKELDRGVLDGITVVQSQSGFAITWAFDFARGMARCGPGENYLIGYLDHTQTRELRDFLVRTLS